MSAKNIDRFKNAFIAIVLAGALVAVGAALSRAATPGIISYQGRILVSNAPFSGTGQFNFALVDNAGTTTFWSNDNTSVAGSQPTAVVSLPVTNGLYSVYLGDTTITNMTNAIPATVFSNGIVKLPVWFNDGTNGSKLLAPDQRIVPVGYAMTAAAVDDGVVTPIKINSGAATNGQALIANGTGGATFQTISVGAGAVNGTLPIANGGTADTGTVWTAYTPSVMSSAGNITSSSATGSYKSLGKTISFSVTVTITTNGTGSGYVAVSLPPFVPRQSHIAVGMDTNVSGKILKGFIQDSNPNFQITNYDNSYPGSNGAVLVVSGTYGSY